VAFAALVALVLSACGSSSKSTSSSASAPTLNSPQAKQFRSLVGISDSDLAKLTGKTFKFGAILPLSGPGAQYATEEQNGLLLAIDEMKRYVGLKVDYVAKDHKSGDPVAGAGAARELGVAGFGAVANSYYADFGATLPSITRYHMLSLDPGGGTGNGFKGKPFFYGFRANTPDDGFVALRYFKQKVPSAKRVAMVAWDAGAAYYGPIEAHLKQQVSANGMQYAGKVLQKIGQTDYSSIISKLRDLNPDIIWLVSYATDPANFMKQYVNSGLKAQAVGSEYTAAAQAVAGNAYSKFMMATDYFPFSNPPNPLSKFMTQDYQRLFGAAPNTFYTPNYYDVGLAYLELLRRVADSGGDINSGDALNKALQSNPTFKDVYGGTASTVGTLRLSLTTHDPEVRPVGLFQASGTLNLVKQLAVWNIGGGDFKIVG
jgi:ABC-type branched-subunit amino acid transport system substrate-binding protein